MGTPLFIIAGTGFFSFSAIMLLYLVILGTGAQSVMTDRDI